MAEIIIRSFEELKDAVIKNLKEGAILSIDISGREEDKNDEDNAK